MKTLSIISAFQFLCLFSFSQTYIPNDAGSKVHFVIRNFGFKVGGDFTGIKGSIVFNPHSLVSSRFAVSVDASSIDTDNSTMENHLRKPDFFDVAKFPLISFTSNRITESTVSGRFYVFGNLTIKGITKPVEFGFGATPSATGYVFTGGFEINRRDFGVGGNSFSLSDNVKINLEVAANK